MNKSNLYRVGVGLFLAMLVVVFAGSWVVPASAAPGDDQPFTYTITARGTSMQQYYPPQSFSWTVTTTGTETWGEYGVLLGEWTIEQWGFGENVIKSWPAPANAVIKRWSYTQQDLGWQVAQGWDTGTQIEGSGLNNQLDISFFTGGTILWRGGYRATYRIYGDLYHYDPASKMQSGNGIVNGSQGERPIANVSLAAPPGLHGGTVAVSSRTVTDTNSRVTTTLDEASGTVYAITSYSETFSGPWTRMQTAGATVNTADGNKYIATSNLVAPNGDTTWSVVDNQQNVDTWMEGNKLYARVLSIADKPFNYTIQASGTKTTTTYPSQGFNWTVKTDGTETWVQSDILLGEVTILQWGYAQVYYFHLDAPANSQITRWDYDQHDLGWQYAQGWDGGSYLEGSQLVIKAYTGGTWLWTGGYWATYRIYGNQYHYDPVSKIQSGSGGVNGTEGDKFIADFSLAPPPAQHGGTVAVTSRTVTDTSGQVTTRIDEAAGKLYASTSYSVTTQSPWSSTETGASAVNCAEGDKYITTSTLAAPDGNTTWAVADNNANVDTWMVGNKLYARALNLAPTARDDSNLAAVEDAPLVVAAPGVLGNDFDPEGDIITALIAGVPSHGNLTLNPDGSFTYTPNANYNGPDSFTYVARDFSLQSDPATVSIVVAPANDLPTISNIANRTISEDGTTGAVPFIVGDIETPAGSITLSATSSNPTLVSSENIVFGGSGANRTLTVAPAPNENGTTTITVGATDADGGKAEDSFVLTVTAVNDAPTITDIASQTTNEDTPTAAINFIVGDAETPAGNLTLLATSSNPALAPTGSIAFGGSGGNRSVTITPAINQSGTANITVMVSDGTATASDSFLLTVNAVNDLPSVSNIPNQTVNEDETAATISFTVSDQETPAGSLIVSAQSSDTTLVPNENIVFGGSGDSRTLKITPASDQNGTCVIAVWVEDSDGGKVYVNFVLTVNAVNDVPSFTKGAYQTVLEDAGMKTVTAWATNISSGPADESDQTLSFIVNNDNNSLFAEQPAIAPNGTLTYRSAANAYGSAVVSIRLRDSGGTDRGGVDTSASQSFTILVTSVNDAPVIASPIADVTADEDDPDRNINLADVFADADAATNGDSLAFTLVAHSNPTLLGATISGSSLTLHYNADENGSSTVTVRAADTGGLWVEDSFQVAVNPVNDPPVIMAVPPATVNEGASTTVDLDSIVSDMETPDSQITWSVVSGNTGVSIVSVNSTIRVVTITGVNNGTAQVTLTATDRGDPNGGSGSPPSYSAPVSTSAVMAVIVSNVTPSILLSGDNSINENSLYTLTLGNVIDPGQDNVSGYSINWGDDITDTFAGSPNIVSRTHTYADGPNNYVISISLSDEDGTFDGGTESITVDNVAPSNLSLTTSPATTDENENTTLDGSFTDPGTLDTHAVVIKWGDGSADTTLNLAANVLSFTATHQYLDNKPGDAAYAIDVSVTDKDGASTSASTTVVVKNVAPVVNAGPDATLNQGDTFARNGSFTDPGSDTWAATVDYGDGSGTAPLTLSGKNFSLSHVYANSGFYWVTVSVTDDDGGAVSDRLRVTVIDNVAPTTTAGQDPAANANGWNNDNVTVSFSAIDNTGGTGVKEIHYRVNSAPEIVVPGSSATVSLADEGVHTVAYFARDNSGNSETAKSLTVRIDKTAPAITATRTPANANGWNNGDVTVAFTASDSLSSLASVTPDVVVSAEGAGQSVTGTALDLAGNSASVTVSSIKIDKTKPVITATRTPANANGWNNGDVTVAFTASDSLSSLASVTPDVVVSAEGPGQSVTGTAVDLAGNSASVTVGGINIDKTKPVITATRTPANAAGWNNGDVTVAFTASDSLSSLASVTPDAVVSAEGAGQSVTGTAVDLAGNSASVTVGGINIDKTKPVITATRTPANAAGWNNVDMTVDFTASDSLSGIESVTPDTVVSTEGAGQSVTGTAVDLAGNSASVTVGDINIDKTKPVITATRTPPNAAGWNNGDVAVDYSASDSLSSLASVTPDIVVSTEGAGQSVTGTAVDLAGNSASVTVSSINIDKTAPVITATRTPANANGWNNVDVTVAFTASDSLSGIESVTPEAVVSTEGAGQSVTGTAVDLAGNSASVTVGDINIDKTLPIVTITSPQASDYLTSASITLDFGSVDALSGIADIVATLDGSPAGNGQVVDLAGMAGNHTLTVVATDVAGNSLAESTTFVVVIDSTVDVNPDTLNLKSKSDKNAVTVYVEFPAGYDVSRIDLSTVVLNVNGTLTRAQLTPSSVSDFDGDGVLEVMVKFDRAAVIAALGATTGDIRVIVSGQLTDGRRFLGSDTIKVINPAK